MLFTIIHYLQSLLTVRMNCLICIPTYFDFLCVRLFSVCLCLCMFVNCGRFITFTPVLQLSQAFLMYNFNRCIFYYVLCMHILCVIMQFYYFLLCISTAVSNTSYVPNPIRSRNLPTKSNPTPACKMPASQPNSAHIMYLP